MRRLALRGALLAMVSTVILLPGGPGHAAPVVPTKAAAAAPRPTNFGLHAMGYGTTIKGGDIPLASGATGFAHITCTTLAGLNRSNGVANVDLPGLGTIDALDTRVATIKKGKTVTAVSHHALAGITLLETALGKLSLGAVDLDRAGLAQRHRLPLRGRHQGRRHRADAPGSGPAGHRDPDARQRRSRSRAPADHAG